MASLEHFKIDGNMVYPGTSVFLPSGWRGQRGLRVSLNDEGDMIHFEWYNRGRLYREQYIKAEDAQYITQVAW